METMNRTVKRKKAAASDVKLPLCYELELHRVIEVEAYLRAEKDGFKKSPADYWHAAEKELHHYYY